MLTLTEAFNDSVLYAYFILRIKTEEFHLKGNAGHDIFIASHRLQASLQCGHDSAPWVAPIIAAAVNIQSRTSSTCPQHGSDYRRTICTSRKGDAPRPLIPSDRITTAICHSVATCLPTLDIIAAVEGRLGSTEAAALERDSSFWLLMAACFLGDDHIISEAIEHLQIRMGAADDDTLHPYLSKECLHSSLNIAAGAGNTKTVHSLLDHGLNINAVSPNGQTSLMAAVSAGHITVVQTLLETDHALQRTGKLFEEALAIAAAKSDVALRWALLRIFLHHADKPVPQRARDLVFTAACRHGDVALAEFLVAKGPIDVFAVLPEAAVVGSQPFKVAIDEGHVDIVRWIIAHEHEFVSATAEQRAKVYDSAYIRAISKNQLDIFLELLPLRRQGDNQHNLFYSACRVDGALEACEVHLRDVDLHSMIETHRQVLKVGDLGLYYAMNRLRTRNMEVLLERGCRLSEDKVPRRWYNATDPTAFPTVMNLLARYGIIGPRWHECMRTKEKYMR